MIQLKKEINSFKSFGLDKAIYTEKFDENPSQKESLLPCGFGRKSIPFWNNYVDPKPICQKVPWTTLIIAG